MNGTVHPIAFFSIIIYDVSLTLCFEARKCVIPDVCVKLGKCI